MKRNLQIGKVVAVEWADALAGIPAWTSQEDLDWKDLGASRKICSTGTVIRCTKDIVALAQNMHSEVGNVSHVMIVPISLITKITELK